MGAALVLSIGGRAAADDSPDVVKEESQSEGAPVPWADPNTLAATFGYLGGTFATVGYPIPLYRERPTGFRVQLASLIALLDRNEHTVLPSEYWRGRVGLELGAVFDAAPFAVELDGLLEHESDHGTLGAAERRGETNVFFVNDVGARLRARAGDDRALRAALAVAARAHLVGCTRSSLRCYDVELSGAQSAELTVDLVIEHTLDSAGKWRVFAALHGGFVAPSGRMTLERRGVVEVGASWYRHDLGTLSVLGTSLIGSDLGLQREIDVALVGAAIRWRP